MPITTISFNSKVRNDLATTKIAGIDLFNAWNLEDLEKVADEFLKYDEKAPPVKRIPGWWIEEIDDNKENDDEKKWYVELLAWYVPAHSETQEYGIHFDTGAMLRYKNSLCTKLGVKNDLKREKQVMISVILDCFWHEVCHGWVEDFVTLYEFYSGQTPSGSSTYPTPRKVSKGFPKVPEEEAVCNTCAVGMLKTFWQNILPDNGKEMIVKIEESMKASGKGYEDFISIDWYAPSEKEFREMMVTLLTETYGVKSSEIADSVFFYQNLRGYPLFLEGKPKK